jgi:hypothetical protein
VKMKGKEHTFESSPEAVMIISTRGYVQYPTLVVFDRRTEKAEICELNGRVKATWHESLKTMMAAHGGRVTDIYCMWVLSDVFRSVLS